MPCLLIDISRKEDAQQRLRKLRHLMNARATGKEKPPDGEC